MGFEHGVEIVETAKVIPKFGLPDLNDQCGWVQCLIAKGVELGVPGGVFSVQGSLRVPSLLKAGLASLPPWGSTGTVGREESLLGWGDRLRDSARRLNGSGLALRSLGKPPG
jgi:hypothetical protein